MNTNLLNIVKQIIADNGEAVLAEPARLKAFFSDLAKDEPKPLRIAFGRCIETGAYGLLKETPDAAERAERKAAITRRVFDEHGIAPDLCAEALDILEAAVLQKKICAKCGEELREDWKLCPNCGNTVVGTSAQMINTPPETPTGVNAPIHQPVRPPVQTVSLQMPHIAAESPTKTHTLRNVLIAAAVLAAAGIGIYFMVFYRPVRLNDYGQIIFTQKKNNDELVRGNFALTSQDVKATQKFIKAHFPDFDFMEEGYETDDYRNELLIKEFNANPEVMKIYLNGISEMSGKSQVYAYLLVLDDKLYRYYFSIDQEFSDRSGFEYHFDWVALTMLDGNGQITSIDLQKHLFSDTNEPYWKIDWDSDIPARNRLVLLRGFLNRLRYTKVFTNLGRDFFKDVYTGIDKYQTIEDIVDWWGERAPVSYTEEIYVESWERLRYVLSNYTSEIERAIYEQEGKDVDLDKLDWFENGVLSANVKNAMNRLNVDYSYPIKINGIVNKRMGKKWLSAYFR